MAGAADVKGPGRAHGDLAGADVAAMSFKPRTPCQVVLDGSIHQGMVMDRSIITEANGTTRVQYYVHIDGTDKRLDQWVDQSQVHEREPASGGHAPDGLADAGRADDGVDASGLSEAESTLSGGKARKSLGQANGTSRDISPMPIYRDEAPQAHAVRNIDRVTFGQYDIKTWYYSPYPLDEEDFEAPSAKAAAGRSSTPAQSEAGKASAGTFKTARNLFVCEGCFKYMTTDAGYRAHQKLCANMSPPGKRAYQRGQHTIWEVAGEQHKLYGQNLSLFGKLFIDHKTIYYDVEPFKFYVLTETNGSSDHPIGFFSREIVSYDDYNLACIVTFPPYQQQGYGTLLMEFSYYLSALERFQGTPERPLSDLGLKGYLSFWMSVVLRTLALAFNMRDLPVSLIANVKGTAAQKQLDQDLEVVRIRTLLAGGHAALTPRRLMLSGKKFEEMTEAELAEYKRRKRMSVGRAGEAAISKRSASTTHVPSALSNSIRAASVDSKGDVSMDAATEDLLKLPPGVPGLDEPVITLETTLERLCHACNLRVDDAAFALAECGLLLTKAPARAIWEATKRGQPLPDANPDDQIFLITEAAVRREFTSRKVKRPLLDLSYVLLE